MLPPSQFGRLSNFWRNETDTLAFSLYIKYTFAYYNLLDSMDCDAYWDFTISFFRPYSLNILLWPAMAVAELKCHCQKGGGNPQQVTILWFHSVASLLIVSDTLGLFAAHTENIKVLNS